MNDRLMGLEGTYDSKGEQKKGASSATGQWKEGQVRSHVVFYQKILCMDTGSKLCKYAYFFFKHRLPYNSLLCHNNFFLFGTMRYFGEILKIEKKTSKNTNFYFPLIYV